MRKKYQSYRILSARTVSATGPRNFGKGGVPPNANANAWGGINGNQSANKIAISWHVGPTFKVLL